MNNLLRGIVLIALLAFFSCKDDDSLIGDNFIDSNLEIHFDTITNITTQTIVYDQNSFIKSGADYALLGDYHDETFGDHKAMPMFNFAPESNTADFGDNPVADTLRLTLAPVNNTFYGYDEGALTITVYRLSSPIKEIDGTPLSEVNLNDYYNESDIIGQTTYTPVVKDTANAISIEPLEIDLIPELAQEFMELRDSIKSDIAFLSVFHGILLKAEKQNESAGIITTFNYQSTASKLTLIFHNDDNPKLTFNYYIDESDSTSQYNFFEHDYSTGSINSFITTPDPVSFIEGDSLLFLQSMRSLEMKIKVNMADSKIFEDKNIVINKALLTLTPIYKTNTLTTNPIQEYAPPSDLILWDLGENESDTALIPDYIGQTYNAASYNSTDEVYNIILSRLTFDKIAKSDEEYTIWAQPYNGTIRANRAVFYGLGATDPEKRPKIIIHYSKRSN